MKTHFAAASALLTSLLPFASAQISGLEPYEWENRVLIIFEDAGAKQSWAQESLVMVGDQHFEERDMVVLRISDEVEPLVGEAAPGIDARALRRELGVGDTAFRTVLIGKDGGVKLKSSSPICAATLFNTVDAMPMRRQEISERRARR
jgi:hypothetical protein